LCTCGWVFQQMDHCGVYQGPSGTVCSLVTISLPASSIGAMGGDPSRNWQALHRRNRGAPRTFSSTVIFAAAPTVQDRDDLAIPNIGKRVRPSPATRCLLLGWQARIILDPVAGRRAEAGFGGSNGSVVGLSGTHVQPHLVVGDVEAGQGLIPQSLDESEA